MRAKAILVFTLLVISALSAGAATYKTIYSFSSWDDASNPYPGVIFDQAGHLYGVSAWGETNEGVIFQLTPSQGQWTFHRLHEFDLQDPDGAGPKGGLVMDEAGNLYGTASYNHGPDVECGTLFKLSPGGSDWSFTVLHKFTDADGCDPEAALTYSKGWLLGTTRGGGAKGQGTVFSMDTNGGSYQFKSFSGTKGREPLSAFNLWGYGTTYSAGMKGQGNIYRLDSVKGLINKHSFTTDGKAGHGPMGDLLILYVGGVRTMYGTTSAGGVGGGGTVYRLEEIQPNSDKWRFRVLTSFWDYGSDFGWAPMAGLTADAAGNLYGTTYRGGQGGLDCGTVFKLSPNGHWWGTERLYSFDYYNNWVDGCGPTGGLVLDKAGNLYGTTQWGGEYGFGSVYEIIP